MEEFLKSRSYIESPFSFTQQLSSSPLVSTLNCHPLCYIGEGNGTPLQYSCLENPMDGGAWQAAVHGVMNSWTQLSDFIFTFMHWRRKWQPTPVFLPGESQKQRSLVGCCLGVAQSRTRLQRLSSSSRLQLLIFHIIRV